MLIRFRAFCGLAGATEPCALANVSGDTSESARLQSLRIWAVDLILLAGLDGLARRIVPVVLGVARLGRLQMPSGDGEKRDIPSWLADFQKGTLPKTRNEWSPNPGRSIFGWLTFKGSPVQRKAKTKTKKQRRRWATGFGYQTIRTSYEPKLGEARERQRHGVELSHLARVKVRLVASERAHPNAPGDSRASPGAEASNDFRPWAGLAHVSQHAHWEFISNQNMQ